MQKEKEREEAQPREIYQRGSLVRQDSTPSNIYAWVLVFIVSWRDPS